MSLEVSNVSKSYPGVQALDNVSFSARRGAVHALLGVNGAGKSTLTKILTGYVLPDSGSVKWQGQNALHTGSTSATRAGFIQVPQTPSLVPDLSIEANIMLGRETRKWLRVDNRSLRDGAERALDEVGLNLDPRIPVRDLRPSEKQLVSIARALSRNPELLILDEPTASLSSTDAERLFTLVKKLVKSGSTVFYVSHRMGEVLDIAQSAYILRDGKLQWSGSLDGVNEKELVKLIVGAEIKTSLAKTSATGPVALTTSSITRRGAFENVSLELREGEIVGLGGLVGSGRSEVLRTIAGLDKADSGDVTAFGGTTVHDPRDGRSAGISIAPEDRKLQALIPLMSVSENLLVPSFSAVKRGFKPLRLRIADAAKRPFNALGIRPSDSGPAPVSSLSGGNQQKVVLGRILEADGRVVLLDEPTAGVDVGSKAEIHHIIRNLASRGKAILVVSSDDEELIALASRVYVMRQGKVVAELNSPTLAQLLKASLGETERKKK
jgi:ABC-type sugar transport system ATPase subunit